MVIYRSTSSNSFELAYKEGGMFSIDRQARGQVFGNMILAEVFLKLCKIDFSQQADNYFRYKTIALRDQISDKDDK